MKQEEDLLLKYLCMALPYGVICNDNRHGSGRVTNIDITPDDIEQKNGKVVVYYFDFDECGGLKNCKPYLRTLDSMTRTELHEVQEILGKDVEIGNGFIDIVDSSRKTFSFLELQAVFEWLLKKHFDFMCLVPKGLAIAVTEENNPYEN